MNLLVTLNDNYIRPLFVMLDSLFAHEKTPMNIYLFYSDVSQENRERLNEYIRSRGCSFFPILIDKKAFQNAPVFRYFTREMYYRLLCGVYLPKDQDRVLYLDPDILIRGPIRPFYETAFQGRMLAGVADHAINSMLREKKKAIGFLEEEIYINSGVLLFNLRRMRNEFSLEAFIGMLERYGQAVSYPDQDMINLYFRGEITFGDRMYNYNTGYGSIRGMLGHALGFDKEAKKAVIVHFMGASKPWQPAYYGKFFFEYYGYLRRRLTASEKVRFFFKPFYVAGRMGKALLRCLKKGAAGREKGAQA